VPDLKPVYLVSGDDDARIDAWRARARTRAEAEGGPGALEAFDATDASPSEVAVALATLSFVSGDRYLLVDGVERWRAGELGPIEEALSAMPEATVLVLIARGKPPARLDDAVKRAGGELRECAAPKPWEMPRWISERAAEEGLHLDTEAAKALVAAVGTRPKRLAREIELLAVTAHPRAQLSAEQVGRLAADEGTTQVYDLADALVAADREAALVLAERLRRYEERPTRLAFPIVRRLREVHRAAGLIDAGLPEKRIAAALRMPPWAAKRTVAKARQVDRDALERALCAFADLEVETRGGGELDEDTAFTLTLARAAG
jgi:DNA polymerase-3 subunit delta